MPLCTTGARVKLTERCCLTSTSSKSLTVVPSSMLPERWIVPVATRSASIRLDFPVPEWPNSTTCRTWSAVGALPAAPPDPPAPLAVAVTAVRLLAIPWCARSALTREHRVHKPPIKNLPGYRRGEEGGSPGGRPPEPRSPPRSPRPANPAPGGTPPPGPPVGGSPPRTSTASTVGSDGHAERAAARHDAPVHSGGQGTGAHPDNAERHHGDRHRRRGRRSPRLVPHRRAVPRRVHLHDLRVPGHAGRRAGPAEGDHGHLGSVPGLDHGPDRRRRHLRRARGVVFIRRAQPAARRGVPVLPGHREPGVLCEGPGAGAGAAL